MVRHYLALTALAVLLLGSATAVAGPTFYGFVKLDASLDSAMTDNGDYAYLVLPYADGQEDDEFNMTANQSRVGVKIDGPDGENVDVSGRIEFDFYGGGAENKANPRLRHAYLELKFPVVDVVAGQTADVVSPLYPTTVNFIVLRKSGNIGYRRPQIRLTKAVQVADGAILTLAASANRSMGRDYDGEDAGVPSFQGRAAFAMKLPGGKAAEVGVSGLWGREETTYTATYADSSTATEVHELDATGLSVDVSVPFGEKVALKGEYFSGKNLTTYVGGIGQGVAEVGGDDAVDGRLPDEVLEIEATGWWGQATVRPAEGLEFNVGAGSDDPELPEGDTANDIEKNTTYYGNVIWTIAPSTTVGVEYAKFETEYTGDKTYQNARMQLSLVYKF